jgi:hypothetical protein
MAAMHWLTNDQPKVSKLASGVPLCSPEKCHTCAKSLAKNDGAILLSLDLIPICFDPWGEEGRIRKGDHTVWQVGEDAMRWYNNHEVYLKKEF